jgi:hypothetical protein
MGGVQMNYDNKSEGPYTIGNENGQDCIVGPGFNIPGARITQSGNSWGTRLLQLDMNLAHAEGVKAERKRCARIAKLNCTVEEIVDMIMGGQDGE